MTNTTELRKRLSHILWLNMLPRGSGSTNDCLEEILDEIEAAEKAKEEHTAERIAHDAEMTNHHRFAIHIRSKFLTKPNHE